MGNISQRMGGKPSARVIRPDGTIVEYDYCIQVAMLMTLHPDHLVIHCSYDAAAPGKGRSHINVMDPEGRLRLGESYIMYPIPLQYKEMVKAAPGQPQAASSLFFGDLKLTCRRLLRGTTVKGTRRRKLWRMKLLRFPFSRFARQARSAGRTGKVKDGGGVPLLQFDSTQQSFISTSNTKLEDQHLS